MNRLITNDSEISLKDEMVNLNIKSSKIKINIDGKVEIEDISDKDLELEINIKEESTLIYNKFNKNCNLNLTINENKNSKIIFNYSLIAEKEINLKLDSKIINSNNECIINVHGLTKDDGNITSIATANIEKNIKNINMLENIRIIMLNDKESIIIPNLLVSSNNVCINHNASISGIDEDYLFYLSSKGISKELGKKIIAEGFLKNNISENLKEGIKVE